MRKLITILCALLCLVAVGCKKEGENVAPLNDPKQLILGKWNCDVNASYDTWNSGFGYYHRPYAEEGISEISFTFDRDSVSLYIVIDGEPDSNTRRYTVDGDKLYFYDNDPDTSHYELNKVQ